MRGFDNEMFGTNKKQKKKTENHFIDTQAAV